MAGRHAVEAADGEEIYCGPAFRRATAALLRAVEDGISLSILTGEPEIGKTTVLRDVIAKLRIDGRHLLEIESRNRGPLTPRDLMEQMSAGLAREAVRVDAGRLLELLTRTRDAGNTPIVVVDNAELLSDEATAFLGLWVSLRPAGTSLVQLVLCGRPEFWGRIRSGSSRLSREPFLRDALPAMTDAEARDYVEFRLRVLGHAITQTGLADVVTYGMGSPGRIERLLEASAALVSSSRPLTSRVVAEAAAASGLTPGSDVPGAATDPPILAGSALSVPHPPNSGFPFPTLVPALSPPRRSVAHPTTLLCIAASVVIVAGVANQVFSILVEPPPAKNLVEHVAKEERRAANKELAATSRSAVVSVVPVLVSNSQADTDPARAADQPDPAEASSVGTTGADTATPEIDVAATSPDASTSPAEAAASSPEPGAGPQGPGADRAAPAPATGTAAAGLDLEAPASSAELAASSPEPGAGQPNPVAANAPDAPSNAAEPADSTPAGQPNSVAAANAPAAPSNATELAASSPEPGAGQPNPVAANAPDAPSNAAEPADSVPAGQPNSVAAANAPAAPSNATGSVASKPEPGARQPNPAANAPDAPSNATGSAAATPEPGAGQPNPVAATATDAPSNATGSAASSQPEQPNSVAGANAPAAPSNASEPPASSPAGQPNPVTAAKAAEPPANATGSVASTPEPGAGQPNPVAANPAEVAAPASGAPAPGEPKSASAAAAAPAAELKPPASATAATAPIPAPVSPGTVGTETARGPVPPSGAVPTPRRPSPPAMSAAMVSSLIRLGDAKLSTGDISAARLLFTRAADAGNARAATKMGQTYDPAYLAEIGATGIAPDPGAAKDWYTRAAALGDADAVSRLKQLGITTAGQ